MFAVFANYSVNYHPRLKIWHHEVGVFPIEGAQRVGGSRVLCTTYGQNSFRIFFEYQNNIYYTGSRRTIFNVHFFLSRFTTRYPTSATVPHRNSALSYHVAAHSGCRRRYTLIFSNNNYFFENCFRSFFLPLALFIVLRIILFFTIKRNVHTFTRVKYLFPLGRLCAI